MYVLQFFFDRIFGTSGAPAAQQAPFLPLPFKLLAQSTTGADPQPFCYKARLIMALCPRLFWSPYCTVSTEAQNLFYFFILLKV